METHPAAPLKETGALVILGGYIKHDLSYVDEKIDIGEQLPGSCLVLSYSQDISALTS